MFGAASGILLGILVGLRHAFEPDHLAAVSTLMVDARGARRGAWLGALWGVGHTLSLLVVGSLLLATGAVLPARAAAAFELGVSIMLVGLGVRAVIRALREGRVGAPHHHAHGVADHLHPGPAAHVHVVGRTLAWRPLAIGLVHGLAGSGALTALVFAELPSNAARLAYIGLFGTGSIVGMAVASAAATASLGALVLDRRRSRALGVAIGGLSVAVGLAWGIAPLAAL
ncbi:MAG: urease accessory protein [Deltaproteobacteria bacterium]|nr:urease accessory protein [Deltaproteobacteria bacterium]